MKHATTLRLSNEPEKALALAEKEYKKANIDFNIQEYLKEFTSEDYVEKFADFIMATNIGLFICIYLTKYLISIFRQNSYKEKIVEAVFRANSCEV